MSNPTSRRAVGHFAQAERVDRLVDLLGLHKEYRAVQTASEEWGIAPAQVRRKYLPLAREVVAKAVGRSRAEMIREHDQRLNAIYNEADNTRDKLAALAQLAALHGLNAPSQVAVTVDVLYSPEEQLRALSDPVMLEKVLALDADFEQMRTENANGDGTPINPGE